MYFVNSKLYIAGEYAIVQPNCSAVIKNIPITMNATITPITKNYCIIYSSIFNFTLKKTITEIITCENYDNDYSVIECSLKIACKYLTELNIKLKNFSLTISSAMHDKDNNKYGLGSSGAVVVLSIKTILELHNVAYTSELLFKLSAITLLMQNSTGSMGDIACIAYDCLISYTSFDRDYIKQFLDTKTITEIINLSWPYLQIKPIFCSIPITLLIGWTYTPVNSATLVNKVEHFKNTAEYKTFLINSQNCVSNIIKAIQNNSIAEIKHNILYNRKLLENLAQLTDITIETPLTTIVLNTLNNKNIAAKTSGAGAGDCIIALAFNQNEIEIIKQCWEKHNIMLLKEFNLE